MNRWNVDRFPWHSKDAYIGESGDHDVGVRWYPCTGVARCRNLYSGGPAAEDHYMWSYRMLAR